MYTFFGLMEIVYRGYIVLYNIYVILFILKKSVPLVPYLLSQRVRHVFLSEPRKFHLHRGYSHKGLLKICGLYLSLVFIKISPFSNSISLLNHSSQLFFCCHKSENRHKPYSLKVENKEQKNSAILLPTRIYTIYYIYYIFSAVLNIRVFLCSLPSYSRD